MSRKLQPSSKNAEDNENQMELTSSQESEILKDNTSNGELIRILTRFESSTNANFHTYIKVNEERLEQHDMRITKNTKEINQVKKDVSEIKSTMEDYRSSMLQLSNNGNELNKQAVLKNNLSICGIPFAEGENLIEILFIIARLIGVNCQQQDLQSVYRTKNKIYIIAKFVNFETKVAFLENKLKRKVMLIDIYGVMASDDAQDTQVFINNHLTPHFGRL